MEVNTNILHKRKAWIDNLRAVAMLLVIYGHLLAGGGHSNYYIFSSPVKIPLFFAISGYVFNSREGDIKGFFKNIIRTLVIPLLAFTIVLLPIKYIAAKAGYTNHTTEEVVASFLTGNEMWYLPCIIFAEIIHFFTYKVSNNEISFIVIAILLSAAGFFMAHFSIMSFANINTAFIAQLFLLIGHILKNNELRFVQFNSKLPFLLCIVYIIMAFLSVVFFPKMSIDVHKNRYYCLPLNIAMILLGNVGLFELYSKYNFRSSILSFIGQNTILFYVLHEYVVGGVEIVSREIGFQQVTGYFGNLVLLIITCLICSALAVVFNKYLPFMVGKRFEKKTQHENMR